MFFSTTTDCHVVEHTKKFGQVGKSPYLCTTLNIITMIRIAQMFFHYIFVCYLRFNT